MDPVTATVVRAVVELREDAGEGLSMFPTTETISSSTGLDETTVATVIKTLVEATLIAGTVIGDPKGIKYTNLQVQGAGCRFYELAVQQS
jgi:hypothetical protein